MSYFVLRTDIQYSYLPEQQLKRPQSAGEEDGTVAWFFNHSSSPPALPNPISLPPLMLRWRRYLARSCDEKTGAMRYENDRGELRQTLGKEFIRGCIDYLTEYCVHLLLSCHGAQRITWKTTPSFRSGSSLFTGFLGLDHHDWCVSRMGGNLQPQLRKVRIKKPNTLQCRL